MELLISLIAGAVGGNIAGVFFNHIPLAVLVRSIAGIVGGGLAVQGLSLLSGAAMAKMTGGTDAGVLLAHVASGAVGGAVMLAVVSVIHRGLAR